ncbi:epsin domain-containing protein [Mycena floridula]|nr:epsin domain-containing protein [Mycena floridula]
MQHLGKAALRVTKNYTKGYSDTQAKVRDATSNDAWGPSGTQMNEIAQLTFNQGDFVEIMEMLDKRLNDKGKNWRHVFKSLTVLDYCLHQGSENVIIYFRDNIYIIKTLKEFQYIDEEGKDQGANVRQKAKDITNLLQDPNRLNQERKARASMRNRMIKGANGEEDDGGGRSSQGPGGPSRKGGDDDLRKAIEESKRSLAQEQLTAEERDLQQAIKLSEEEEARRNREVEDSNSSALFDDQNQLAPPTNQFAQPTFDQAFLQQQYTQQPQFQQIQPQFTSFNPYQQQAELEQQQQYQLQMQQLAMQRQQEEENMRMQMLAQQQFQQQQQQQQQFLFAQQQQPLVPQHTMIGSNNPFAQSQQQQSPTQSNSGFQPPTFNLQGTYQNHNNDNVNGLGQSLSPPPQQQNQNQNRPIQVKTRADEDSHLASLFANRDDGQDTYGQAAGKSIALQPTGHNPFAKQQQQQADQPFFSL